MFCSWDNKTTSTTGNCPPRFPETATKSWLPKLLDVISQKCLKEVSPLLICRLCRFCWNDSACLPPVRKLLSANCSFPPYASTTQLFFQSLPSHTLGSGVENFLPLPTSVIFSAANTKQSAPTSFAAETAYLHKNRIRFLPISYASSPNPLPRCRPLHQGNGIYTCRKAAIGMRFFAKTGRMVPTDAKGNNLPPVFL